MALLNETLGAPVKDPDFLVDGRQIFSCGHSNSMGLRPSMEDASAVIGEFAGPHTSYYAVFDGHGGVDVARYLCYNFHREFQKRYRDGDDVYEKIKETFKEVSSVATRKWGEIGCTVAILMVINGVIYTANVGDSRIILIENKKVTRMTYDHKATDPNEAKLIKDRGGFVFNGRVNGVLALSRAIGDGCLEGVLIRDPYLKRIKRKDGMYAIIGCDGVWDVMSDEEAAVIAARGKNTAEAARLIRDEALKRGSQDNVSVLCINLTPK